MPNKGLKIAILGTRGIPNNYGGFEQLAEFLSIGLVKLGHQVYVYNSSLHPYREKSYKDVNLIKCFDPENMLGTFGQFIYDFNCILDSRKRKFDVILQLGYTSSSVWAFLFKKKSIILTNMDGLEWTRSKYGYFTKKFLKIAEKWAINSSTRLIADNIGIQNYLKRTYDKESSYIAYGAEIANPSSAAIIQKYGLMEKEYNLVIARFEPENNIELILKGHTLANSKKPLVIIGNHQNKYGKQLYLNYKSSNVIFLGPNYNMNELNAIRTYAANYFHGHSVGGTNPSLLEAMASSVYICAHNNEFNKSVLGNDASYFESVNEIVEFLKVNDQSDKIQLAIQNNLNKIAKSYSWQRIINQYNELITQNAKAD